MSMLPVGIGSAEAGGYQIERSLRFNSADSAYLNRTPASDGNRRTWTWSGWVKRSALGSIQTLFNAGANSATTGYTFIDFTSTDTFRVGIRDSGGVQSAITTQVFRDPSAWGHLIVAVDTTQATASNRVKIYFNGSQISALGTANYPTQNTDTSVNNTVAQRLGVNVDSGGGLESYLNGYLTEINFIDGQALTPSSFGETDTDTGVWKPKKYTGSYGTNGFYLNFSDNSGTTSTTLGKDSSGNGNNWTPNNFSVTAGAGNDSLVDTPTNYGTDTGVGGEVRGNYATWNPLATDTQITFSNGNLDWSIGANDACAISTIGASSGKWYAEFVINTDTNDFTSFGVATPYGIDTSTGPSAAYVSGQTVFYENTSGQKILNDVYSSYGSSFTAGDIIGVALNIDSNEVTFYKNNVSQGAISIASGNTWVFIAGDGNGSTSVTANFGQRPFAYTAPSGFKALCTQNLPEPTIADGGDYFNAVTYTGTLTDGQGTGATQSITGVGFQPDFLWLKNRTNANQHLLVDAVRTVTNYRYLNSASTGAESTVNSNGAISALNADGFTVENGNDSSAKANLVGRDGWNYVAWNWKANGAGSTNTAGTTSATVSVNTTSGFSVITATTPSTYTSHTVGHGLGVTPAFIIYKERNQTSNWQCWHKSLSGATNLIQLNTTGAEQSGAFWGTHTSTVIACGGGIQSATSSPLVMYAFAPVAGYSAFGRYTGNGSADGPFVFTNFRPAFVMVKRTDDVNSWNIWDDKRNPYNQQNNVLYANTSAAEDTRQSDFISNGFKLRGTSTEFNASGGTYIYMAFAESPFRYSLAR